MTCSTVLSYSRARWGRGEGGRGSVNMNGRGMIRQSPRQPQLLNHLTRGGPLVI